METLNEMNHEQAAHYEKPEAAAQMWQQLGKGK